MIRLVIGTTGQYKRKKKKNGKQTKHTAAKPKGFPLPEPVEMYLSCGHQCHVVCASIKEHEPHHGTDDPSNEGADDPCYKPKGSVPAESSERQLAHYAAESQTRNLTTKVRTHTAHTDLFSWDRNKLV